VAGIYKGLRSSILSYNREVEKTREWFEVHRAEIIVGIIGAAISMAIAIAMTGDFNDALARTKRR